MQKSVQKIFISQKEIFEQIRPSSPFSRTKHIDVEYDKQTLRYYHFFCHRTCHLSCQEFVCIIIKYIFLVSSSVYICVTSDKTTLILY